MNEELYEQNTPIPLGATHQSACGEDFYYVLDGTVDVWDDTSEHWVDSDVHPDDLIRM
jgi:mannose-6-phosphate isomerase-like protein (cupin superfamily)